MKYLEMKALAFSLMDSFCVSEAWGNVIAMPSISAAKTVAIPADAGEGAVSVTLRSALLL